MLLVFCYVARTARSSLVALLLAVASLIAPGTASAQHTSVLCPAQTAAVTAGGSVTINISACEFPGNGGTGGIDGGSHPIGGPGDFEVHGVATTRQTSGWFLDYSHNGSTGIGSTDVFELSDGSLGGDGDILFTITINPSASPITVLPAALPTLTAGTPFSQTLTSSGGLAPYTYALQSGVLPIGLTLTSVGVLSGTPTQRGAYSFSVRSTDSTSPTAQFVDKGYTGTVQNPTLSLASASGTAIQSVAFSQTLSTNGGVTPYAYQLETGSFPAGISISSGGVISGTTAAAPGNYPVTIRVTDSSTGPGSYFEVENFTLTVSPPPSVSIAVSPASVSEDGATNLTYTVTRSLNLSSSTTVNITTGGTATSGTDYTGGVATVVIPSGATTATITINPTVDGTVEADETVILTVDAGTGYTVGAPASATGTILNDDLPNLTINDVTANEGNAGTTSFTFTVSLSAPAGPGGVTFDIATANGSATAGVDYVANSLTGQTIPAASSTYTFTVQVNGDALNESNETFFVNVTNVTGAIVVDGQGDGIIVNDDVAVINGACGTSHSTSLVTSAPSTNLCSLGTAGSVTSGTSAFTWSCTGSGGGSTDSCSASRGYTVTPSAGSNGSISPNTPQVVAYNATPGFTATPATDYAVNAWAGSCSGTASGTGNVSYTTSAVTTDCTVSASFSGTDSTPDAFSFTAVSNAALSTLQTSNTITVAGITTGAAISITGGEYQIGSGSFDSTGGTVNNGDTVTVRHTSSAAHSTATTTTLTIGGVSADFVSTTAAPVINGACGTSHSTSLVTSAPGTNLCSVGTAGSVTSGTSAFTWSCTGSGGGSTDSCSASRGYTVTPSAGSNGSISPNTPQVVAYNATPGFTATPASSYGVNAWAGSCNGTASGTGNVSYTTSAVTTDCTVSVSFTGTDSTPDAFSFTAVSNAALSTLQTSNTSTVAGINTGAAISITGGEYQIGSGSFVSTGGTVNNGDTVTVRHTSSAAHSTATTTTLTIGGVSADFVSTTAALVINGACGTSHSTSLVTSAPSTNLCSLGTAGSVTSGTSAFTWSCTGSGGGSTASCSASRGYTVTPSAGTNGSITPSTPQVVAYNATPSFTVTADSGFTASVVGSCGGTLTGGSYATNAVTADCSVAASAVLNTSYTDTAPGSGGTVSTQLSGGGGTCGFTTVGYQSAASVGGTLPAGYAFPHGVLAFTTSGSCTPGGTIMVTLTYPSALPTGTKFFKYGPAAVGASPTWYEHPATIGVNTITYSVTDNGQGDNDAAAGLIADPAGAAVPSALGAVAIPTLAQWALMLLTGLVLGLGLLHRSVRRPAAWAGG